MTTGHLLAITWTWEPSILIGCAALVALYFGLRREIKLDRRALLYCTGVAAMFFALTSPLEKLGDTYLFSLHMLQHLLLLLVTPPLMLAGMPPDLMQRFLDRPRVARLERILGRPLVAWILGMGTIWIWHWPALYNAALLDENIHILEHLCFLVTATIFWWPILAPVESRRLQPLATIPYLFAAAAASSALGIILTFSQPGLYPAYVTPVDRYGALSLIRDTWGLTLAVDQQLGGLFMWVPGSLVYLSAILVGLARWYATPEEDGYQLAR